MSTIGMMTNSPGPRSARKLPSRSTTARSHWFATLIENETASATSSPAAVIQLSSQLAEAP